MERDAHHQIFCYTIHISTHTLTWSVTLVKNVHSPKSIISTHTLTWSVTYSGFATGTNYQDFNSHAHVERDTAVLQLVRITKISTHTLTWSVTNSTVAPAGTVSISTHTLTWSVTGDIGAVFGDYKDFNSHAHVERDT